MAEIEITRNDAEGRYEARMSSGDLAGFLEFERQGEQVLMPHTEVDPAFGGMGVGQALAKFALDDTRATGLKVIPACPFVKRYIERNPEYQDLV